VNSKLSSEELATLANQKICSSCKTAILLHGHCWECAARSLRNKTLKGLEQVIPTEEEVEMFRDAYTEYAREVWCGEGTLESRLINFCIELREEESG